MPTHCLIEIDILTFTSRLVETSILDQGLMSESLLQLLFQLLR